MSNLMMNYLSAGQTTMSNIFLTRYRQLGLDDQEFAMWIQIYVQDQNGYVMIDFRKIADDLQMDIKNVYQIVNQLVQKNMVTIYSDKGENGQLTDRFSLNPAYEKLQQWMEQVEENQENSKIEGQIKRLFGLLEQEFGRPLSGIEFQRVHQWLDEDHYLPALIELALKEAVLNQVYNFNYIDRILLAWERKNIRTKEQVANEQKNRQRKKLQSQVDQTMNTTAPLPKVTLHNWLDEEDNDK